MDNDDCDEREEDNWSELYVMCEIFHEMFLEIFHEIFQKFHDGLYGCRLYSSLQQSK